MTFQHTYNSRERPEHRDTYKCPHCHDMGWISFQEVDPEYSTSPITLAKPCPYCNQGRTVGNESEMPGSLATASMEDFDFNLYTADMSKEKIVFSDFWKHFDSWQAESRGLYLWSNTYGSGKTFLACCLANSTRIKNHIRIKFISAINYINKCSDFKDDISVKVKTSPYKSADLLVLDDIGAEKKSDWNKQCLNSLIDYRYSHLKVTIYTSNYDVNDLAEGRISDRIFKSTLPIRFPEESIRKKLAEKENKNFVRIIMARSKN